MDFTSFNLLQLFEFALALLVSGAASGLIAGLFGVGGGIITVPVLFTIFKLIGTPADAAIHMAVGTSLAVILVTARASVRAHKRKGAVDVHIVKRWAVFVLIGATCGAIAANRISGPALTLTFAIFSVFIAALMGLAPAKLRVAKHPPKGLLQVPLATLIGFISALVGVGGGSLSVPTLVLCDVPMHRAVGTAAAIGLLIAFPATVVFLMWIAPAANLPPGSFGYVNLIAFAILAPATMFTAPLGAKLAHHLPALILRRCFAAFLILVAMKMMYGVFY